MTAFVHRIYRSPVPTKNQNGYYITINCEGYYLTIVWFRNPYICRMLKQGNEYVFRGMIQENENGSFSMFSPLFYTPEEYEKIQGTFIPVYRQTKNLRSGKIQSSIEQIRDEICELEDTITEEDISNLKIMPYKDAVRALHFPSSWSDIQKARHSIRVMELYHYLSEVKKMKVRKPTVFHCGKYRPLQLPVKLFPHYFVGSNADLPIVGGSILSHDHFQGGHYTFAMETAPIEKTYAVSGYEDVEMGIVKWPLSVLRLRCKDEKRLIKMAAYILDSWRGYTDEAAFIFAETDGEPHNTITPIARKKEDIFELDLTLRNNITTKEHPLGVYHPHAQWHNIKKENIGLIEVMGLAVLPARLDAELDLLGDYLVKNKDISKNDIIEKHADWVKTFRSKYQEITEENVKAILENEVGKVFIHVLEDAGVYKCTEEGRAAFERFIATL